MGPNTNEKDLFLEFKKELGLLFAGAENWGVVAYQTCNSKLSLNGTVRVLVRHVPQHNGYDFQKQLKANFESLGFKPTKNIDIFLEDHTAMRYALSNCFFSPVYVYGIPTQLLQFEISEEKLGDVVKRMKLYREVEDGLRRNERSDEFHRKVSEVVKLRQPFR